MKNPVSYIATTASREASWVAKAVWILAITIPAAIPKLAQEIGAPWLARFLGEGWYWLAALVAVTGVLWEVARKAMALEEAAKPKIRIHNESGELEYRQQHRELPAYCLKVENTGGSILNYCLAKVISLTDAAGNEINSQLVLRTEHQKDGRPEGAFNLRGGEEKHIVFGEPYSKGDVQMVILAAEGASQSIRNGKHRATVRVFADEGSAAECVIEIENGKAWFAEIERLR